MKLTKPKPIKINDKRILDYFQVCFPSQSPETNKSIVNVYEFDILEIVYDGYSCDPQRDRINLKFSIIMINEDTTITGQLFVPMKIVKNTDAVLDTSDNVEKNRVLISSYFPFMMTSLFHRKNKNSFYSYCKFITLSEDNNIHIKLTFNIKQYVFINSIMTSLYEHKKLTPLTNNKLLLPEKYTCIKTIPFNIDLDVICCTFDDSKKQILLMAYTKNIHLVILVGASKLSSRTINRIKKSDKYINQTEFVRRVISSPIPVINIKNRIIAYFSNSDNTDDIESYYFLEDMSGIPKDKLLKYNLKCIEFRKPAYDTFIDQVAEYVNKL